MKSLVIATKKSRGRKYSEPKSEIRNCFQKDRDRIIHSKAFRRLKDKTQVFVTHHDDHNRNRLSHTIEVAQIARDMSRMLDLNEDLAESIALAHDLGHTPFGHAGESALNECMQKYGMEFEHNEQSRRIVEELESGYPDFPGLNLSIEVIEGLMKHRSFWDRSGELDGSVSPEAEIVNIADEIAYQNHDVDDGLRSNLFSENDLESLELWKLAGRTATEKYGKIKDEKIRVARTVSKMIGIMILDVTKGAEKEGVISFSPEIYRANKELKDFLSERLYFSETVLKHSRRGQRIIRALFQHYEKDMEPERTKDFIAGMTDRFAERKAEELLVEF